MGPPAPPSSHPNNQKAAALWTAEEHSEPQQHPYVQYSPVDHKSKSNNNPIEPVIHVFNSWSNKAESLARNIWQNLKTGSSVSEAVYGKVGLTTKVLTGGGFEALYKQTFNVIDPNEKLKKTFACYLSTSTGPVAGTLYLTNIHVAFCSDRPLSFPAPSGQVSWSYYKVMIPLAKISSFNPINMKENPVERYIQIATVDNHDFWFMGFVNYDKASLHLSQSLSQFVAGIVHPV
ncbi:Gem-like protein [Thalictrum thalictroides]|uniref:Gem-like protein n=1 Tax=Thalictrum thalictroides TaxID=46969 RepID=A0A7J6VSY8_THATH|nr:Gem-like protein [Thalictrum thalictroides]